MSGDDAVRPGDAPDPTASPAAATPARDGAAGGRAPLPEPLGGRARIGSWRRRFPQVLALAVVWVLLWGSLNPLTIIGGVVVGLAVTVAFPLPLLPDRVPLRPWRLLRLAGFLVRDLVVSGVRVSVVTVVHGPKATAGILGLPLCTTSDRVATTVAAAVALSPGSFVLQIDRPRNRWYVYALGLHRPGSVERVRRDIMVLQTRVIEALGSDEDIARCRAATAGLEEGR